MRTLSNRSRGRLRVSSNTSVAVADRVASGERSDRARLGLAAVRRNMTVRAEQSPSITRGASAECLVLNTSDFYNSMMRP